MSKHLHQDLRWIIPQLNGGWWHHRQTAQAPVDSRIFGGFVFVVDGDVDGNSRILSASDLMETQIVIVFKKLSEFFPEV